MPNTRKSDKVARGAPYRLTLVRIKSIRYHICVDRCLSMKDRRSGRLV